jgi:LuxR family maltose regulon positive regulatory protein
VVAGPLLETKLYRPIGRRDLVSRPRLIERLNWGCGSRLTLVSAPAGFGKTTLLTAWLADSPAVPNEERCVAWLSLDGGDNDPGLFWTYVIAALASVVPGFGASCGALLEPPQRPPTRDMLTSLLNELTGLRRDVVLVLDDYHVIDSREVEDGMAFLLDHLPPLLHVVIASRADPALPLPRLRARGDLVEVRAADLRFTEEEASAYLTDGLALPLTRQDVATLTGRTEGWIAALQLAALSLQGRDDVTGFLAAFAGDDRYIVDYLVEEVLQRQPEQVSGFLLRTSILDRLNGSLCDALTGDSDGRSTLETLDRANLFLVPLDDRRRWYRYHHLFADVLRARLLDERPDEVPDLHRRASGWYAGHGEPDAAVQHALAAEDLPLAAELVELAIPGLLRERREATLRGWFEQLPVELFRRRPVLSMGYVAALLAMGQVEGVELRLRDAERWLGADATAAPVVADEEEYRRLPASVAVYRAALALVLGDAVTTVAYAERALNLLEEDDHVRRGAAAALLGLASWGRGDLDRAYDAYADCSASLRRAGNLADVLGCATTLADIRITQGRLQDARLIYDGALRLADQHRGPVLRGTADIHVGISGIARERGNLADATEHLLLSQELGERAEMPRYQYRWRVAMAGIREAEGDLAGALELLDESERVYVADFAPDVRPIAASRVRVWLAQGRLADAVEWARRTGLSVNDELSYLHEFEHVTLARVLLARSRRERAVEPLHDAVGLLDRLLAAADAGGRTGTVLEILVLQAVAHQQCGNVQSALASLERALTLAEPEGHVRLFLDEGRAMAVLLKAAADRGLAPQYVERLLGTPGTKDRALRTEAWPVLPEPLSEREREVLHLLQTDLSGPQIARELVVSLNTVRTHTRNIYAKLGVTSRRAAVRRAEELDLSTRSRISRY